MLARRPQARSCVMLMRRASARRLTARDLAEPARTDCFEAGPGIVRTIVSVTTIGDGSDGVGLGRGAGSGGGLMSGAAGSNSLPITVHRSVECVRSSGPVTVRLLTSVGVIVVPSALTTFSTLPPVTVDGVAPSP